jgi:hypothetical protein
MNTAPFNSNYGTNTTVLSADINSFLVGATNNPTPDTGSYARFQKIGPIVNVEFKYIFATVPTTGAMSINLPLPINSNYPKPQSVFHIRYLSNGGAVHYGLYNEKDANGANLVAPTSFHGAPVAFTNLSPDPLAVGDIITGLIIYETS